MFPTNLGSGEPDELDDDELDDELEDELDELELELDELLELELDELGFGFGCCPPQATSEMSKNAEQA